MSNFCETKPNKTTKFDSKSKQVNTMTSKLIYDIEGCVDGVEKSYYEMSDAEIKELMGGLSGFP